MPDLAPGAGRWPAPELAPASPPRKRMAMWMMAALNAILNTNVLINLEIEQAIRISLGP